MKDRNDTDGVAHAGVAASPPASDASPGAWALDDVFVVNGTEFLVTPDRERYLNDQSTPERFVVAKTRAMIDRLRGEIAEHAPSRIVELGIFKGGSAALLASLASPRRLSAIEISSEPVAALDEFIAAKGLGDIVRPHYGVDQGDARLLAGVIDEDHGGEPLDLVVDDASHYYRETRTSFEVLFPRLRHGGIYVIEDWGWAHYPDPDWQAGGGYFYDRPAMTNFVIELLMVAATGAELISRLTVLRDTVTVERGPLQLECPIKLEDCYCNRGLTFRPMM